MKVKEESKVKELKHVSQNLNSVICKYTEKVAILLIIIKYYLEYLIVIKIIIINLKQ